MGSLHRRIASRTLRVRDALKIPGLLLYKLVWDGRVTKQSRKCTYSSVSSGIPVQSQTAGHFRRGGVGVGVSDVSTVELRVGIGAMSDVCRVVMLAGGSGTDGDAEIVTKVLGIVE